VDVPAKNNVMNSFTFYWFDEKTIEKVA